MKFVSPQPFRQAVDKLGAKSIIGSRLNSLEWSAVPVALRERAFFSSRVESARFLQRGRNSIADYLQSAREAVISPAANEKFIGPTSALKTGSRADFVKQLQDFARAEGLGELDINATGEVKVPNTLTNLASERRLGLIFDTQTRQAQDYGAWKEGQDPDILNAFPAQRFIRVHAVKEPRQTHHQYEGMVRLKSDPFWSNINQDFGVPWGPWGWGCGHDVEDVARKEAVQLGILAPDQPAKPSDLDFNRRLEASTANLDPDLIAWLKRTFGTQIEITGDTAKWVTSQPSAPSASAVSIPALPISAPAAAPEEQKPAPARRSPVSRALTIIRTHPLPLEQAKTLIDQIHDDGILPRITVDAAVGGRSNGVYRYDLNTGRPTGIGIKIKPGQEITFFHETGHFLDHQALGIPGQLASPTHPDLAAWRDTIQMSSIISDLRSELSAATDSDLRKHLNYILQPHEMWARSYAQWIARLALDKTLGPDSLRARLQDELVTRQGQRYFGHWSDDEFHPIAAAIEALFKKKGWM